MSGPVVQNVRTRSVWLSVTKQSDNWHQGRRREWRGVGIGGEKRGKEEREGKGKDKWEGREKEG